MYMIKLSFIISWVKTYSENYFAALSRCKGSYDFFYMANTLNEGKSVEFLLGDCEHDAREEERLGSRDPQAN